MNAPQVVEDADAPERRAAPPLWGRSRPWWSADSGEGTGPQAAVRGGSGAHPVAPGGSGAHPVVTDGTGPLQPVAGQAPNGAAAPPPKKKKRLRRFLLVAGIATVSVAALGAGVVVFRYDGLGSGGGTRTDARTIGVPASEQVIKAVPHAGGLHEDPLTSPETSAAYPFVAGAVEAAGVPAAADGVTVYSDEPARPVNVLFMGGTGAVGDPEAFLQKVQPTTFIAGQDADPGEKGGKAVCGTFAVLAETHTFCAWATQDSYGVVASNRAMLNPRFPLMADVMRRIRGDVEKPK